MQNFHLGHNSVRDSPPEQATMPVYAGFSV